MTLHLDVARELQRDHAAHLRSSWRRPAAAVETPAPRVRFVRGITTVRVVTASPGHPVGCIA